MDNYTLEAYQKLVAEINFHNYRYHVLDDPVIGDTAYDKMLHHLMEIEAAHPGWVRAD